MNISNSSQPERIRLEIDYKSIKIQTDILANVMTPNSVLNLFLINRCHLQTPKWAKRKPSLPSLALETRFRFSITNIIVHNNVKEVVTDRGYNLQFDFYNFDLEAYGGIGRNGYSASTSCGLAPPLPKL